MIALTPARKRELRAKAHHLHPVVSVGQHGLTGAVMHEIDVNLLAHELIKVRVFSESRDERDAVLERICAALGAAAVQHIGKLLVLWRPAPEASAGKATRVRRRDASPGAHAQHNKPGSVRAERTPMAKSAPQARRPREPVARAPARPPVPAGPRRPLKGPAIPSPGGRRRRGAP